MARGRERSNRAATGGREPDGEGSSPGQANFPAGPPAVGETASTGPLAHRGIFWTQESAEPDQYSRPRSFDQSDQVEALRVHQRASHLALALAWALVQPGLENIQRLLADWTGSLLFDVERPQLSMVQTGPASGRVRDAMESTVDRRLRAPLALTTVTSRESVVQPVQGHPGSMLWCFPTTGRVGRKALLAGLHAIACAVVRQAVLIVVVGESGSGHAHKLGSGSSIVK